MKKLLILMLILVGCGGDGGSSKGGSSGGNSDYINFDKLPDNTDLSLDSQSFNITGVKKVNINLMNFNKDFRLKYSKDIRPDEAQLDVYSVEESSNNDVGVASASYDIQDDTISFSAFARNYSCAISVSNGDISAIGGACYARIILTLPEGAKVEVRNAGQLYTENLYPMTEKEYLNGLGRTVYANRKLELTDGFIESYKATGNTLIIDTKLLEKAISRVSLSSNKLSMFEKLHGFVSDRENLEAIIESSFTLMTTKEKARQIAGL